MTAQSQMDYKNLMVQLSAGRLNETTAHHAGTEGAAQARIGQSQQKHQLGVAQKAQNIQLAGQTGKLTLAQKIQNLTIADLEAAADIRIEHEKAKAETETATP